MKKLLLGLTVIFSLSTLASPPPPPPPATNISDAQQIYDALNVQSECMNLDTLREEIEGKFVGCFSCDKTKKLGQEATYLCGVQMNEQCDSEKLYKALKVKEAFGMKRAGGLTCTKSSNAYDCQYFH